MRNKILSIGLIVAVAFSVVTVGLAFSGSANVVIENVEQLVMNQSQEAGMVGITTSDSFQAADLTATDDLTVGDDATIGGDLTVAGSIGGLYPITSIAATNRYATTTLTVDQSGTTFLISASGTRVTLPASTTAEVGTNYRFQINGATDTASTTIASYEGDNIEGTLIVAGAVVDCAAEDFVHLDWVSENVGDYVELMYDGTNWLIQDSGILTTLAGQCTDPS